MNRARKKRIVLLAFGARRFAFSATSPRGQLRLAESQTREAGARGDEKRAANRTDGDLPTTNSAPVDLVCWP